MESPNVFSTSTTHSSSSQWYTVGIEFGHKSIVATCAGVVAIKECGSILESTSYIDIASTINAYTSGYITATGSTCGLAS